MQSYSNMAAAILAENFVIGEDNSAQDELIKGIKRQEFKLLELVEALGIYLTSTDTHRRCRATGLLSQVIRGLPEGCLNTTEGKVLVAFFCDRLKDHHSVTPHVLNGLNALALVPQLSEDDLQLLMRSIFREVHLQTLAQGDRRHFYTMVEYLLQNRLSDIKKLGGDMVYGFMQAMDAEKDPRNLTIAFRCACDIAMHFPVAMFAEEYFEVVSCYFPIDFSPPPNDPYGVKKEDLVLGLRNVFSSTPAFAEFALPLLLEKLQPTVINSKIDALHTLAVCVEVFGWRVLEEYVNSFWSCIRREVFSPVSNVLERASLAALTAIIRTLSLNVTSDLKTPSLEGFLRDIFKDLKKHLCETELRLMYPSSKLLMAAGAGSSKACSITIEFVIPLLQEQFFKHQQCTPRRNILDIMNSFVTMAKESTEKDERCPLEKYKDNLLSLYTSELSDSNHQLRILAGQGLAAMATLQNLLEIQECELVVSNLTNLVLTDSDCSVRKDGLTRIASISQKDDYDQIVLRCTVTKLVNALREEPMDIDSEGKGDSSKHVFLNGLEVLSTTFTLVKTNVEHLINYLASFDSEVASDGVLHETKTTCLCIQGIVNKHIHRENCIEIFRETVLHRCLNIVITNNVQSVLFHIEIIDLIAGICRTIVSHLRDCDAIVKSTCQLVLKGDTSSFTDNVKGLGVISGSSELQLHIMPLFNAVICCTKRPLQDDRCDEILKHLFGLPLSNLDRTISLNIITCAAALLNKMAEGDTMDRWLTVVDNKLGSEMFHDATQMTFASDLLVWTCKAVVMRGHKKQQLYVEKLLDQLTNEMVADICAEGFKVILEENPCLLNNTTHANIKLMYRQRFFLQTLSSLISGFNLAKSGTKQYFLKALSHHLKYVPKEAVLPELPNLLPLLIQSLHIEETGLQLSTLSTIVDLVGDSPNIIVSHIDDIIPRLILLTHFKPSMKVRMAALKCLACMTSLPHSVVYPHQNEVIRSLATGLNDHKRLVRKEAVNARSNWFLVGSSK